ncbi:MAG: oligopeptide/dipeptide ABC transporter ATP-binding protein [Brevinema sp.]
MSLLDIKNLCVYYPIKGSFFAKEQRYNKAVDGVSFSVNAGETVALVGESGSGKTSLGRAILRLTPIHSGQVIYNETDLSSLSLKEMLPFRKEIQMVFQDPYSSLNPRMSVGEIIGEALLAHKIFPAANEAFYQHIIDTLLLCGLEEEHLKLYPHQFSGGQRQRIGIARALALNPKLLIADEAVSALDVSIKAQIIQLLKKIQQERGISYLFITHDLSIINSFADRVFVMYGGKIVESAPTRSIFLTPKHPYTQQFLASAPLIRRKQGAKNILPAHIEPIATTGLSCPYAQICPKRQEKCVVDSPILDNSHEHAVACFFAD